MTTRTYKFTGILPDDEVDAIVAQFGNPDTCAAWVAAKDALRTAKAGDGSVMSLLEIVVGFERVARRDFGVRYKLGL